MPYPNNSCSGEPVAQPCCDGLWVQGNTLLSVVAQELQECMVVTSCCANDMRMFVSLGSPETFESDILAVYLSGLTYSSGSTLGSGAMVNLPMARAQWVVYLMESCYPLLENGETPNDDVLHLVNEHAYAHGEAIYRAVLRSMQPDGAFGACSDFQLGTLAPILPQAGNAGWTFVVQIGIQL